MSTIQLAGVDKTTQTVVLLDSATGLPIGPSTLSSAQITDGTNGIAAVKPASTAALATDKALVVAISPNGQLAAGQATMANSTPVAIASDQSTIPVRPSFKTEATYSAALNVTVAAAATDIAVISGSASKTVKVNKVIITGVQTTGGLNDIQLVKRSTADTGGTSTAATAVPHDSADAAATASVLAYTVNPAALGTSVGNIRRGYLPIGGATSIVNPVVVFDFGAAGKEIYLRGIAQQLAVNLNGATLTGGAFDIDFEWTEV